MHPDYATKTSAGGAEAVATVGEEKVLQYEKYLRLSSFGFDTGRVVLLGLVLMPVV
jgi:hypothetical protein